MDKREIQSKEKDKISGGEGAEEARTGHVGVHCVRHFPLPARAEKGAPGWSPRGFSALLSGRAWHVKIPVPDRDVSGLLEGGVLLELLGRVKAKRDGSARGRPPSPPGKWANEKHTLA